jgi:hypothetical protein
VISAISLKSCRFSANEKYLCNQAGISPVIPRQRLSVKWENALYLGNFSFKQSLVRRYSSPPKQKFSNGLIIVIRPHG